ncbi:macro domain-containing protein [candidate division KSB1 bacterium]|nr:macro domain-containing protein [candidate division KSB1 bacterium]
MKIRVGQGTIEVVQGDITSQGVDAVVNAANNHLWMGSGVAGAIKKNGGQEIETEAVKQGPVEIGEAVITTGGNLSAKYVIHAVGMGQDLRTDSEKVRNSTRSSLKLADENKIESIAFPAIGTGVGGFSLHQCAQVMLNEAINFLTENATVKTILFVLFDDEGFRIFEEELRSIFSSK